MTDTLIKIFLPIVIGYLLLKLKYLPASISKDLKLFVVRVAVPCRIFISMYNTDLVTLRQIIPLASSYVLLTILLLVFTFILLIKIKDNRLKATYIIAIVWGNYGWIGWAVLDGALGSEGLSRGVFFTSLWWPVLYLGSLFVAKITKIDSTLDMKNYILNMIVPIISLVLGIILNTSKIPVASTFLYTIDIFGNMTVPIILLCVGFSISVRDSFKDIKKVIIPVLLRPTLGLIGGLLTINILGITDSLSRQTVLIESTMPVAILAVVIADMLGLDDKLMSSILILSTLLSLLTIPLTLMFI